MQMNHQDQLTRREFLHRAAAAAGAVAITGGAWSFFPETYAGENSQNQIPRLNPAFRIKEVSPDKIELYTYLGDGSRLQHEFCGVEAELFREMVGEQALETIITNVARRKQMGRMTCQDALKQSLLEFEQAKLVYYGEKMLVKIVEVTHAQ